MYCDFCSAAESPQTIAAYCFALEKQIFHIGKLYADEPVDTVFLGGGTPTLVPPEHMARVLQALQKTFTFSPNVEFTSEGNPGTVTAEWLDMAVEHGLNRLSLGVQAAQDGLRQSIGRIHTVQDAAEAVRLARAAGVKNLNLDAMFGLPGQTETDYLNTLETFRQLGAEHISAYSLILEKGTPLHAMVEEGKRILPDEDAAAAMYEHGIEWLERNGYQRYEVSNFAKPGYECRHNLGYWQGAWYLGLGVAAHSMLPPSAEQRAAGAVRIRQGSGTDVQAYIRSVTETGSAPVESVEEIGPEEAMFETMMLGLRTVYGVSERRFEQQHGTALVQRYGKQLDRLVQEKLGSWIEENHDRRFALSRRGIEIHNEVLMRLM